MAASTSSTLRGCLFFKTKHIVFCVFKKTNKELHHKKQKKCSAVFYIYLGKKNLVKLCD